MLSELAPHANWGAGEVKDAAETRLRGSSDRWIIYRSQFCVYLCAAEGQRGGRGARENSVTLMDSLISLASFIGKGFIGKFAGTLNKGQCVCVCARAPPR